MEASSIYQRLGALLAAPPNLRSVDATMQIPQSTIEWLGKASALVEAMPGVSLDGPQLQASISGLIKWQGKSPYPTEIMMTLSRVLAKAEIISPLSASGAFISAGDCFNAITAVNKVISSATESVWIIDPYMDETILSDFSVLAAEDIRVELLTDEAAMKPGLVPALKRWKAQYKSARQIEARKTSSRTLHDRLILIDHQQAWILTQSLKDLAARSPATIQRADPELSRMKVAAYTDIWINSSSIWP